MKIAKVILKHEATTKHVMMLTDDEDLNVAVDATLAEQIPSYKETLGRTYLFSATFVDEDERAYLEDEYGLVFDDELDEKLVFADDTEKPTVLTLSSQAVEDIVAIIIEEMGDKVNIDIKVTV